MAKSFHVFFQKKSPFSAFGVIQDTRVGVQDRTHSIRHPGKHGELETRNHRKSWNQWISGISGISGITGISQPGSGIGRDRRGQGGRGGQNGHMGQMGHFDFSWRAYIIYNKV